MILGVLLALALQSGQLAPVRIGGGVGPPQKIKDVKPVYPPEAQRARVQGIVVMEVTIDPTGHVGNAAVLRSIPMLDAAALDAVRQWEFTPTLLNGQPVPVVMTVTVNFWLDGPDAPRPVNDPRTIRLIAVRTQTGSERVWEISAERANRLPQWDPLNAPVPLPMADAIRTALTWAVDRSPQNYRFEITGATLARARRAGGPDIWFYQIDFFANGADTASTGGPVVKVVILPDGSVLEPRPDPPM